MNNYNEILNKLTNSLVTINTTDDVAVLLKEFDIVAKMWKNIKSTELNSVLTKTEKKNFNVNVPVDKKVVRYWDEIAERFCTTKYIQGRTGEIVRYYLFSDDSPEWIKEEITQSGGAFVTRSEMIFVSKECENNFTIFHESGHLKFRREGHYEQVLDAESGYDAYIAEEIFADNWGLRNTPKEELVDTIIDSIKKFLHPLKSPITIYYHFPRVQNLVEKLVEHL